MNNKDIKFPYYSGNIRQSYALGHLSIEDFINVHKNPKLGTIQTIKRVGIADKLNFKKLKRKLKHNLYSFTPSVYIAKGKARRYDNVLQWTGLMQLDFDGIPDIETAFDIKQYVFEQREIVCSYISPSGTGVKALMRTVIPEDKAHYKALHKGMTSKYEEIGYLDIATKNAMLPLFLSIDYDILYRDINKCIKWNDADWTEIQYERLIDGPPNNFKNSDESDRTIRILQDKINNINSNGHPQVRSAALILGSRVGAGYINIIDAQNEIIDLIKNNNYLSKGYSGYLSTAMWGISEGHKNPKYYE